MSDIEIIKEFRRYVRTRFSNSIEYYYAYPHLVTTIFNERSSNSSIQMAACYQADIALLFTYLLHYTEIYRYLNYEIYVKETNDSFFKDLFELLGNSTALSNIAFSFVDPRVHPVYEKAMEFDSLSAYKKVLYTKALSEKDVAKLCSFNPFFIEEYVHFNVDVNETFLLRQMKKWMKSFDDFDKTLKETTSFIEQYQHIDTTLLKDLEEKYGHVDIPKMLTMIYKEEQ